MHRDLQVPAEIGASDEVGASDAEQWNWVVGAGDEIGASYEIGASDAEQWNWAVGAGDEIGARDEIGASEAEQWNWVELAWYERAQSQGVKTVQLKNRGSCGSWDRACK